VNTAFDYSGVRPYPTVLLLFHAKPTVLTYSARYMTEAKPDFKQHYTLQQTAVMFHFTTA